MRPRAVRTANVWRLRIADRGGVQKSDQGFAFTCRSCSGSGWVHGLAADIVAGIRVELREEAEGRT